MAARKNATAPNVAPVALVVGVVLTGAAVWLRYPGLPLLWLALIVAAWLTPPAVFTGRNNSAGAPTPAHTGEDRAMSRYLFWRDLKFRLLFPTGDWLPGWPVLAAWPAAVLTAALAWNIPVQQSSWRWVNASATFIIVVQVMASRRRTMADRSGCPGVRVNSLPELVARRRTALITAAAAVLAAAVVVVAEILFLPTSGVPSAPLFTVLSALAAFGVVAGVVWTRSALETWHRLVVQRGVWAPRWAALKHDPAPYLIAHTQVGSAVVDTFMAPSGSGSVAFLPLGPKIAPTLGAGAKVALLETPDAGSDGQPMPGTVHPLRFDIVYWPLTELPDLSDPACMQDVAALFARCAFVWALEPAGYARMVLLGVQRITAEVSTTPAEDSPTEDAATEDAEITEDPAEEIPVDTGAASSAAVSLDKEPAPEHDATPPSPAAWASQWCSPGGLALASLRERGEVPRLGAAMGTELLIDHRSEIVYFGALSDPNTRFTDPQLSVLLTNLVTEDHWTTNIWGEVLKTSVNAPIIQHPTYSEATLADGVVVKRQAFVTRSGIDPSEYRGLEPKLATALRAAPYVCVAGFVGQGERPGERHPQAFTVYWSERPVPAGPDRLASSGAAQWVLAGRINAAFDAARLARPEIARAVALTDRSSRGHIWSITLRLYGGVTLADVRGGASRLRTQLGVPWLRVAAAEDGCVLFVGADPAAVKLMRPERDGVRLTALDWEQACLDSKLSGSSGLLPILKKTGRLPHNDAVQVLDFDLPAGLDIPRIKAALPKLRAATGNEFIEVRGGAGNASTVRLLVCPINPLPTMVPYDFAELDASSAIPFATGIEGEPVAYDWNLDPHVLLAGGSGSGKSVALQAFIMGALVRGAQVYVIDPVKGGADFGFAKDRCMAFAGTPHEAAAVMKAIYAEVVRRKNLNAVAGVGSYQELDPAPCHIVVVIDEFTSLMGQDLVPKPSEDPEMEAERENIEGLNQARLEIGVYAGKIAREARSAGVTLCLATQKLTAKMLDGIPGAGDLKDLALDTRLPVPLSARFPSGWARNDELELGDLLYTPDGTSTPIVCFSDVIVGNDVYAVRFDDKQVVKAGRGHLWSASSLASRTHRGDATSPALEQVLTTGEMAATVTAGGEGGPNWAVRVAAPIDGPDADHAVDPYLAGAHLHFDPTGYADIPPSYLRASARQRLTLLQGLMDSVGELSEDGSKCWLVGVTEKFGEQVLELLRSLGMVPHWSDSSRAGRDIYFETNLAVFRDSSKRQFHTERADGGPPRWRHIRSIELIPTVPTRCIGVADPGHLFLVEGFIPTHNTNLSRALLGKASWGDRASALRAPDDAPVLEGEIGKGRGLWETTSGAADVIQSWYAPAAELRAELVSRIPALGEDDRLDVEALLPVRQEQVDFAPVLIRNTATSPVEESSVVDVGEMEFSFDDMDLDDEADSEAEAGTPPESVTPQITTVPPVHAEEPAIAPDPVAPIVELSSDTVLFLDVNEMAAPTTGTTEWSEQDSADVPGLGVTSVSPTLCAALRDLRVDDRGVGVVWFSARGADAGAPYDSHLGHIAPVLERGDQSYGWWKIDALLAYLEDHPAVTRVMFVDDELAGEDELGIPFGDLLGDLLEERGVAHLLLVADAHRGLHPGMVSQMREWLPPTLQPVTPAEPPVAVPVPLAVSAAGLGEDPFATPHRTAAPQLEPAAEDPFAAAGPSPGPSPEPSAEDPFAVPARPRRAPQPPAEDPFAAAPPASSRTRG